MGMLTNTALLYEPTLYHRIKDWGFVSLLQKSRDNHIKQTTFLLKYLPEVLGQCDPSVDTWISQAEFSKKNRCLINIHRIGLSWVDIDYYKTEYHCFPAEYVAEKLLNYCALKDIPPPTLIVSSGQGLQIKYLFTSPIPAAALARWGYLQLYLTEMFSGFGADVMSRDASRVLRLVDSVNLKNGAVVKLIHVTKDADGQPKNYSFDELCDAFLPFTREDYRAEMQKRWATEKKAKQKTELLLIQGGRNDHHKTLTARSLNWHRLLDLRKLIRMRNWDEGVPEGSRDLFLFLAICFLSWSVKPQKLWLEIDQLREEFCPTLSREDAFNYMSSAMKRAESAEKGLLVEFGGRSVDPRYRFTNSRLIEWLKISPVEQKHLLTMIDKNEKQRRDTEKKREKRREAGTIERARYLSNLSETTEIKRVEARLRRARGESIKEIMLALGVSKRTIMNYLQ